MFVTICLSKIIHGTSAAEITSYVANSEKKVAKGKSSDATARAVGGPLHSTPEWSALSQDLAAGNLQRFVRLTFAQFLRFKNSGRQHESADKRIRDPMTGTWVHYKRADRTDSSLPLEKWDVSAYKNLVGRIAPWGTGAKSNRDHLLADSINQLSMKNPGALSNPYQAHTPAELKGLGLAVTVSGKHHREGSITYGGRVHAVMQQHANDHTLGAREEMRGMMDHKNKHGTLRIEMVGAYAYLYKGLVDQGVLPGGDASIDDMLLAFLRDAKASDDHFWRIDPRNVAIQIKQGHKLPSSVPHVGTPTKDGSAMKWKLGHKDLAK